MNLIDIYRNLSNLPNEISTAIYKTVFSDCLKDITMLFRTETISSPVVFDLDRAPVGWSPTTSTGCFHSFIDKRDGHHYFAYRVYIWPFDNGGMKFQLVSSEPHFNGLRNIIGFQPYYKLMLNYRLEDKLFNVMDWGDAKLYLDRVINLDYYDDTEEDTDD